MNLLRQTGADLTAQGIGQMFNTPPEAVLRSPISIADEITPRRLAEEVIPHV